MIIEMTTPAPTDTGGSMPGLSSKIVFYHSDHLANPFRSWVVRGQLEPRRRKEDGGHQAVLYVDAARLIHLMRQTTRDIVGEANVSETLAYRKPLI